MNRKILLGGALTATLGLAGLPWIEDALGGGAPTTSNSVDDFSLEEFGEFDVELNDANGDPFAEGATADAPASSTAGSELESLLSAVESVGAGLRGGGDLGALLGGPPRAEQDLEPMALAPTVDADALRERFPLNSLVLGRGRAVAQLGGELTAVGSVLSDGRTRVRRITERGVEVLCDGQAVWIPLPPVRHVPSAAAAPQPEPLVAGDPEPEPASDPLLDL
jgi:hypothetical protein